MSVDCATGVIKQIEELFVTSSMDSFRSVSSTVPYIYIVLVVILVVFSTSLSVCSVQVEVDWRSRLQRVVDKVVKVVKDSDVHYKGNTAVSR